MAAPPKGTLSPTDKALLAEIRQLIETTRRHVATTVNTRLTLLYWDIGQRLQTEILLGARTEYGEKVVSTVSRELTADYGKGWTTRQLWYCLRITETFPDKAIVNTLCSQLSWSHFRLLLAQADPVKRDFYMEMCRLERWSVRRLQERIHSMLFERTAISRKPEETIQRELDVLRDEGHLSARTRSTSS